MRGRHARAVASVPGAIRAASRRTRVVVAAGAGLLVVLAGSVAAFVTLAQRGSGDSGGAPKAAAVSALAGRPVPVPATGRSRSRHPVRRGDQAALAFYQAKDPARAGHVNEVVWTGPMLRVYTDLPASDADSKTAIALCETAAAYAEGHDHIPVVFVHADREAGYPILANKMSAGDDCRLDRVP